MLDNPCRLRSQIRSVVCQIQRFDFEGNLVLTRKLIIRIPSGLGLNPLYGIHGRNYSGRIHDCTSKQCVHVVHVPCMFIVCSSTTCISWNGADS